MKKSLLALALAGVPVMGMAAESSPHTFTGNVGIYSDYAFRGQSQTDAELALQGGFDYAHSSGVYLGVWASNVDSNFLNGANSEWDFYGGYSGSVGDLGYNVGLLYYYYPGQFSGLDIDTTEFYAGLTYKWVGLKMSYNLDDYFGITDSDGTIYWDLSFNYEIAEGLKLNAHYGWTDAENFEDYEDWKIGITKDYAGFTFGLSYIDTDTTVRSPKPGSGEDLADSRWILSVSKTF